MAKDLAEQLTRLGHKCELLLTRYTLLRSRNAELRRENERLAAAVKARDALIERLELERENLRVSAVVATTPAEVTRTRAMLAELVRDIDACIADLTRDI